SALTSVDLPTLGAPISATKPQRVSGSVSGRRVGKGALLLSIRISSRAGAPCPRGRCSQRGHGGTRSVPFLFRLGRLCPPYGSPLATRSFAPSTPSRARSAAAAACSAARL